MSVRAEYIWIDGGKPTARMRSKTKVLSAPVKRLEDLPDWGFDGSSTEQATGESSDCMLKPVNYIPDPIRGGDDILVLCEVLNADGSVHPTNTRAYLRVAAEKYAKFEAWFGIEQEYTLYGGARPLGWPDTGYPAPQGPFYCGVGADEVFGRDVVEAHLDLCLEAGLHFSGINAEVMPGQWEFQIGPVGPLQVSDEIWFARWLLYRVGEDFGVHAKLHPKPVKGDWNGAGAHVNFSTNVTRGPEGMKAIESAMKKLKKFHDAHMEVYGEDNRERLTGAHETAPYEKFSWGISHRGASVRVPMATANAGSGYFEDRRPAANMDPYQVCLAILETVCGKGFGA